MSKERNGVTSGRSRKKGSFSLLDLASLILAATLVILCSLCIQIDGNHDQHLEESNPHPIECDSTPLVFGVLDLS